YGRSRAGTSTAPADSSAVASSPSSSSGKRGSSTFTVVLTVRCPGSSAPIRGSEMVLPPLAAGRERLAPTSNNGSTDGLRPSDTWRSVVTHADPGVPKGTTGGAYPCGASFWQCGQRP